MALKFKGAWRLEAPEDGEFLNRLIPQDAVNDFFGLIMKVATQGDLQDTLEHYKGFFCAAAGSTHSWSSSESWAESDLRGYMSRAAQNAPLFIEAFYEACETLRRNDASFFAPDATMINALCSEHRIGYEIRPPDLVLREVEGPLVAVPERPPTLAEQAVELFQESLKRSEQLLSEGRGREAVQELLWLLESVTTAFRGLDTGIDTVGGKYFNQIVRDLRKSNPGRTFDRALEWMGSLHGYLSSPTGGGVRHGLDLSEGIALSLNEARLFSNLIRSYLSFLLVQHERLTTQTPSRSGVAIGEAESVPGAH